MKKYILIVDDDALVRKTVRTFCGILRGVEHLEAATAEEAIRLFDQNNVVMVISDLNMPGESGLHLLRHVRLRDRRVPFVINSGSLTAGEDDKLRDAGADLVLTKGADFREFIRMIRSLLKEDAGVAAGGAVPAAGSSLPFPSSPAP